MVFALPQDAAFIPGSCSEVGVDHTSITRAGETHPVGHLGPVCDAALKKKVRDSKGFLDDPGLLTRLKPSLRVLEGRLIRVDRVPLLQLLSIHHSPANTRVCIPPFLSNCVHTPRTTPEAMCMASERGV